MVLQPQGPMARGHLTTTGTQDVDLILSQSPEDEHAQSAVFFYSFHVNNTRAGACTWIGNIWARANIPSYNKPIRNHCKTGGLSARLVFETRAKCQDFVDQYKDDGIPYEVDSPFWQRENHHHSPPV